MEIITQRFNASLDYLTLRGGTVDAIADVIATDCKAYYINEKIRVPIKNVVLRSAFTTALLAFDRDTDRVIAKEIVKQTHTAAVLHLDSLYDFCLDILKSRWDEVCLLANENIGYLVCQKTFMELLQFLISNIDCKMDETMFMHIRENTVREDVKKMFPLAK
jgi:hypothetical protein